MIGIESLVGMLVSCSEAACPPLTNDVSVVSISEDDVDSFAKRSLEEPGRSWMIIHFCFSSILIQ